MVGPLDSARVAPIVAVSDLDRARRFYEDELGLAGEQGGGGGWALTAGGGTSVILLPGVSTAGSADWPVATFEVDDVHATVRQLRDRGVPFLSDDDIPFDLDEDGVSTDDGMRVAWMKDPDGSVLTVYSLPTDATDRSVGAAP